MQAISSAVPPVDTGVLGKFTQLLVEINQEWDAAEGDIKVAEQVCQKVVAPAINELRYAGRRLADALTKICANGSDDQIRALLQDAKFDCHRARHDAIDAALSKIAIDIDIMVEELGYEAVLQAYPAFARFNAKLQDAAAAVAGSRADRENRQAIYESLENSKFPDLIKDYRELRSAEPIMLELARSQKIKHRKNELFGYCGVAGLIFGVIGVVIGIISIM